MSDARERFLDRVREAVVEGNHLHEYPATVPERGTTGYQGAGSDPIARFLKELQTAGGHGVAVASVAEARDVIETLLGELAPKIVLLGRWQLPSELAVEKLVRDAGAEVLDADTATPADALGRYATADLGLTGCDHLLAETGSVVIRSRPEQPRSLSLLPPVHIVVATARQMLPDLFDLFAISAGPPAGLTIITGPSKTGDIEGQLVTGVHGPGQLHVIVIQASDI